MRPGKLLSRSRHFEAPGSRTDDSSSLAPAIPSVRPPTGSVPYTCGRLYWTCFAHSHDVELFPSSGFRKWNARASLYCRVGINAGRMGERNRVSSRGEDLNGVHRWGRLCMCGPYGRMYGWIVWVSGGASHGNGERR